MGTYLVTRDVPENEEGNYGGLVCRGTILYSCMVPTYGCINEEVGLALTHDSRGNYPFFQFPKNAVMELPVWQVGENNGNS